MNKTIKIILIILAVVIIGVLLYFFVLKPKPVVIENVNKVISAPVLPLEEVKPLSEEEISKAELLNKASDFVERLYSYSNQTNFETIKDLKDFSTQRMKNWIDNYIEDLKTKLPKPENYFGVTTRTLSSEILDFSSNQAEIKVQIQKRESNGEEKTDYGEVKVTLIKENDLWKIDQVK